MSALISSYHRPGVSVLTVAQDPADAAEIPGFVEAALPCVEEIVILLAGVDDPLPAGMDRARVRTLRCDVDAWNMKARIDRLLHTVAGLPQHEWSVWLPPHARLDPASWSRLRSRISDLGRERLTFRLPGEPREYATHYRQTAWRSAWRLRPSPSGALVSLGDGMPHPLPTVVIDSLDDLPDRPETGSITRCIAEPAPGVRSHVMIAGAPASGGRILARMLSTTGFRLGDELLCRGDASHCLWLDRAVHEANSRLVPQALDVSTRWPGTLTSRIRPGLADEESRRLVREATARTRDGNRWAFQDPLFALTLPVWKSVLGDVTCLVPVRHPAAVATSIGRELELPHVDSLRLWRAHGELLLDQLATLGIPALFVDFDRLRANPHEESGRIAAALGIDAPSPSQWLQKSRPSREDKSDSALVMEELLGKQELPGEGEAILALHEAFREAATRDARIATTLPTPSGPERAAGARVVVFHGDPDRDPGPTLESIASSGSSVREILVLDATGHGPATGRVGRRTGVPAVAGVQAGRGAAGETDAETGGAIAADSGFEAACPIHWCDARTIEDRARGYERAFSPTEGDALVLTRTDVVLARDAITRHLESHPDGTSRIALGRVNGHDGGDNALFGREAVRDAESLFGEEFPANTSIGHSVLGRIAPPDTSLECGFEFVDFALRAHAGAVDVVPAESARARIATTPPAARSEALRVADHQKAAGRALVPFLERHPRWFPRDLLRSRVWEGRELIGKDGVLREHLEKLGELTGTGSALPGEARQAIEVAANQLATISSVLGLTRSDPRAIRLLGRDLWSALVSRFGERWGDPPDAEYDDALARNAERARGLVGRHAGATAFICGTGPQLARLTEGQRRGMGEQMVVGVNDAHYALRTDYLLSAYFNRVAFARRRLDDDATVVHMRPFAAPPLIDGVLSVQRRLFDGKLPPEFGNPPTVLTYNNVILGATHLALILGARRLVYVGMELSTRLHFYSHDENLRRSILADFADVPDERFFGVDHDYERHAHIAREAYGKSAEVLLTYPNPYAPYDTAGFFRRYLRALDSLGVPCFSTVENSVLTKAGAPYRPLDSFLGRDDDDGTDRQPRLTVLDGGLSGVQGGEPAPTGAAR